MCLTNNFSTLKVLAHTVIINNLVGYISKELQVVAVVYMPPHITFALESPPAVWTWLFYSTYFLILVIEHTGEALKGIAVAICINKMFLFLLLVIFLFLILELFIRKIVGKPPNIYLLHPIVGLPIKTYCNCWIFRRPETTSMIMTLLSWIYRKLEGITGPSFSS